jgi:uncharacterized protein (DUF1697 family)
VARYAAFLRAVNLGARRRASGADLRRAFEAAGFTDVSTFRTSGNVAFDADRASTEALRGRIERALTDALGFEVVVFLRSAAQMRALADERPFAPDVVGASAGKLQVALLHRRPAARAGDSVLALATDADRLAFGRSELYWLPRAGTQESSLDLASIEKLIGPWTMRTQGTLEQLAAKRFA